MTFTLLGKMKSGKNHVQITRTGKRYPSKQFAEWRAAMLAQLPPIPGPFVGPVFLTVDYTPGDNLRRDVPGILDALCHLLEKSGIVLDDAQVKNVQWLTWPVDKVNPKCRIGIDPCGTEDKHEK